MMVGARFVVAAILVVCTRSLALQVAPPSSLQADEASTAGQRHRSKSPAALHFTSSTCADEASSNASFMDYLADGTGNLSATTSFGRGSGTSPCACRLCSGMVEPEHHALHLTTSPSAGLCYSTDDSGLYYHDDCAGLQHFGRAGITEATKADIDGFKAQMDACFTPDRDSADHPSRTLWLIGDSLAGSVKPGLSLAVKGAYQVRSFGIAFLGLIITPELLKTRPPNVQDVLKAMYLHMRDLLIRYTCRPSRCLCPDPHGDQGLTSGACPLRARHCMCTAGTCVRATSS
jgi:hypothetical protein